MIASDQWVTYMCILLAVYALVILYFVVRGARKNIDIKDYAVGNLGFPAWVVGLSLAASMTSAATFIINPGFIALYGFSGIISFALVLPIAAFISLIVFTKGFVKQGNAVKATTMAQWIGKRYNSKNYAFFFGIIALLLITFIVLINVGLTQVISKALNADPFLCFTFYHSFCIWLYDVWRCKFYGLHQYHSGYNYVYCGFDFNRFWLGVLFRRYKWYSRKTQCN